MQAYLGRAEAACLCSYCCNSHLCYDGGRLGRVKMVTLRVGAWAKEGKRGEKNTPSSLLSPRPLPHSFWLDPFSVRVSTCAFARKTFARTKKTPALQASSHVLTKSDRRLLCYCMSFKKMARNVFWTGYEYEIMLNSLFRSRLVIG